MPPSPSAALLDPKLWVGLWLVLPAVAAGQGSGPPLAVPPDARFGQGAVRLDASDLNPPPGFGLAVPGAAAANIPPRTPDTSFVAPDARPAAGAARAASPGGTAPPTGLPPGARFSTGSVVFGEAALNPPPGFGVGGAASSGGGDGISAGVPLLGFGAASLPGVAMAEEEAGRLRFTLGTDTLFDFDKAVLRGEADPVLRKLVEEARARVPGAAYRVEGHTDAIGSDAYNDDLSRRRAAAVQTWLTRRGGVPARDVSTGWFGERRPVAPNTRPDGGDDPEGRQRNRRVEIVVTPRP